jgi:hypothetical protein
MDIPAFLLYGRFLGHEKQGVGFMTEDEDSGSTPRIILAFVSCWSDK